MQNLGAGSAEEGIGVYQWFRNCLISLIFHFQPDELILLMIIRSFNESHYVSSRIGCHFMYVWHIIPII